MAQAVLGHYLGPNKMKTKLYTKLSSLLSAIENCEESNNTKWLQKHGETLEKLITNHLPSGGGFDDGTSLDLSQSTPEKLVFETNFHHMNGIGYYDGWTSHKVIITPSLQCGFNLRITGKNKNDVKEYMYDVFNSILNKELNQ